MNDEIQRVLTMKAEDDPLVCEVLVDMEGVREYSEGLCPSFVKTLKAFSTGFDASVNRLTVVAYNEGGHNSTQIDLLDLIRWIRTNVPQLLEDDHGTA